MKSYHLFRRTHLERSRIKNILASKGYMLRRTNNGDVTYVRTKNKIAYYVTIFA